MNIYASRTIPLALSVAALLAGCGDTPTSIRPITPSFHVIPIAAPQIELLALCKAGPVGTYTFHADANLPVLLNEATGLYTLTSANYTINVTAGSTIDVGGTIEPGACFSFTNGSGTHNHIGLSGGTPDATITIVETGIPAGVAFQKAVVYQNVGGNVTPSTTNVNSATGHVSGVAGANIVFYNRTVPVFLGNSINVQSVRITPRLYNGVVSNFTGSFLITAFDQPVTVTAFKFRISRNGEAFFWEGNCSTVPGLPLNVPKSSVATVNITPACAVGPGPVFKSGDDVRLEVFATLATGRVFSNSGFFKLP